MFYKFNFHRICLISIFVLNRVKYYLLYKKIKDDFEFPKKHVKTACPLTTTITEKKNDDFSHAPCTCSAYVNPRLWHVVCSMHILDPIIYQFNILIINFYLYPLYPLHGKWFVGFMGRFITGIGFVVVFIAVFVIWFKF